MNDAEHSLLLLKEARGHIEVAEVKVQQASNLVHKFEQSKPLNILYKELRASGMLLSYYIGKSQTLPKDGYEIATPQSINAYHNLNST